MCACAGGGRTGNTPIQRWEWPLQKKNTLKTRKGNCKVKRATNSGGAVSPLRKQLGFVLFQDTEIKVCTTVPH